MAASRHHRHQAHPISARALVEIALSPREADQPFADLESPGASRIPLPPPAPTSTMPSSRVPVPKFSPRFERMGKKATSQAPEPTQPTSRRRRRKVTDLSVELATDLELPPIIERWERDLILPHLAQ